MENKKWKWKDIDVEIYYNRMYVDEVKYFLDCVEGIRETCNPVKESFNVLKWVIAAEYSSTSNRWESVI